MKWLIPIMAGVLLTTAACDTSTNDKATAGRIIGAVAGGLGGSHIGSGRGRVAATSIGALLGALLGGSIATSLGRADGVAAAGTGAGGAPTPRPVSVVVRDPGPTWLELRRDASPSWFFTPSTVADSAGYRTAEGAYTPGYTLIEAEKP